MNASVLINCLGWTLVDFVWQGALLACACAVAMVVLRNARPELRYGVACSALLACLAWPAAGLWSRITANEAAASVPHALGPMLAAAPGMQQPGWLAWLDGHLPSLVVMWAVCALLLGVRMGLGLLWIGRMTSSTRTDARWQARLEQLAVQFGVTRTVRLRLVEHLASPVTAGWWRPVVLVPASLVSGLPPDLLEALLAHEMAHVKRFDYLVNLGQNVVETLLFYHPAVWWISGRIRAEREQIADDFAARQLGEPRRLALALSELERIQFSTHHLAQAANGGDLMSRIKRLVRPDTQALNWKAAIPVLGLAAACMGLYANAAPAQKHDATAAHPTWPVLDFRSCDKPHYPAEDIHAGHQGTVQLGYLISAEGSVLDSKVNKSSGYPSLDESARSAIAKCHFKPAMKDDKPVQEWAQIQYVWTLK